MKIPHTVNSNVFKAYEPSKVSLNLVPEANRNIKAEDTTWDENHIPRLTELCLLVIVANFENNIILNELPCWDKNYLLEILPLNLPLSLVIEHVHDEIYWKRKVKDRWKNSANHHEDYGFDWKRMYIERHVQEAVEAMTPEGFDLDIVQELCDLGRNYVKNLNLRELQIMESNAIEEEEEEFGVCDHIDLSPIIEGLENLTELHVQFGLRNVGSDYKKSCFQFSFQDCRNLGLGVAKAKNLRMLRIHSCDLDDDKIIALLSNMEPNKSLEELDFSNCTIQDDGAAAIAKFLKNQKNIKSVNLCNNIIREEGISALAFVITQSDSSPLENLNLKFNSFGDEGLKVLASALVRENSKIKVLKVSCCNLGEESGIFIGEMLNLNSTLVDLDLSNNHLGESAGRALEAALQKNITIQYLDLRLTEISNKEMLSINQALNFNRIRAIKGEKGVEREKKLIQKRMKEEKLRAEEEAVLAVAAAKAAVEEAERLAAAAAEAKLAEQND